MEQVEQGFRMATTKPIIEFRGVSKTYQTGTHALEDVNIKINNGEFVFVVGSSGAGKRKGKHGQNRCKRIQPYQNEAKGSAYASTHNGYCVPGFPFDTQYERF